MNKPNQNYDVTTSEGCGEKMYMCMVVVKEENPFLQRWVSNPGPCTWLYH
jgi:hypothetical protein